MAGDSASWEVLEVPRPVHGWRVAGILMVLLGLSIGYHVFVEPLTDLALFGKSDRLWPAALGLIVAGTFFLTSRQRIIIFGDGSLGFETLILGYRSLRILRREDHLGFFQDRQEVVVQTKYGESIRTMWHSIIFVRSRGKPIRIIHTPDGEAAGESRRKIEALLGEEIPRRRWGGTGFH